MNENKSGPKAAPETSSTTTKSDDSLAVPGVVLPVRDNWVEFTNSLPAGVRECISRSVTNTAALAGAVNRGWRVQDVAKFCAGAVGSTAANPAGIVATRLREAAGRDPFPVSHEAVGPKMKMTGHRLPWCGECTDDRCRWRTDVDLGVRCDCWSPVLRSA